MENIAQQVLTQAVATGTTKYIDCHVPALRFYFNRTLTRLQSSYWGSLPTTMRDDLIDLAGDYAYWNIQTGTPDVSFASFESFMAELDRNSKSTSWYGLTCKSAQAEGDGLRNVSKVETACPPKSPASPRDLLACDMALSIKNLLKGDTEEANQYASESPRLLRRPNYVRPTTTVGLFS